MDSSSESERGEPLKLCSRANGGRMSGWRSPWNIESDITSLSTRGESQPCNFDGYQEDTDGSMRLEMNLFMKPRHEAATSSYSSPVKYWEDFFQLIPSEVTKTPTDVLVQNGSSDSGTITSSLSTEPASMDSDITHELPKHAASPGQSPPPLQVMVRSGGYDPGRIPSSVFEMSKGPTPVEWSIASNESLFSIHLGNIGFLSDTFLTLAGDLQKPEELGKIDEFVAVSPPLQDEVASDSPITQLEMNFQDNENSAGVVNAIEPNEGNGSIVIQTPSLNNGQRDRSSFLPIKKKHSCPKPRFRWLTTICCRTNDCGCLSCSCPNCSPTCCCCCCGWPSCHCKCPSLDCDCTCPRCSCSWLTCYRGCGCNCSPCCDWNFCSRGCCCSCPSRGFCTLSFSWKLCYQSCFSCQKCRHCC